MFFSTDLFPQKAEGCQTSCVQLHGLRSESGPVTFSAAATVARVMTSSRAAALYDWSDVESGDPPRLRRRARVRDWAPLGERGLGGPLASPYH